MNIEMKLQHDHCDYNELFIINDNAPVVDCSRLSVPKNNLELK